ncbi:MAG: CBS domain-containing protein [Armatimonadota bacterium]
MLSFSAKDIMQRDVVTIRKGASIEEALRLMAENNISGLPVVDTEGKIEGIITETDVLLKGQGSTSAPRMALYGLWVMPDDLVEEIYRRSRGTLVEDAMTPKVITFTEESAVTDIARVMIEHDINRVPIVRDGKIVGIVSRSDIVHAMSRLINGPMPDDFNDDGKRKVIELT